MKKLMKYLDRIGADYKPETYGNNYFYNVPEFKYTGIIVSFDYSAGNLQSHYMKMVQQEKMIKHYCDRYGYLYHSFGSFPGCFWFTICKQSDYEYSDYLRQFERAAQDTCERVIHDYHVKKLNIDLEKTLRKIMDSFGKDYLEAMENISKVTFIA